MCLYHICSLRGTTIFLDFDVLQDPPCAPPNICLACKLKLTRSKKIKGKKASGKVLWNIPVYTEPTSKVVLQTVDQNATHQGAKRKVFDSDFFSGAAKMAMEAGFQNFSAENKVIFVTMSQVGHVLLRVTVECDYTWTCMYKGTRCRQNLPIFEGLSQTLNLAELEVLLKRLAHAKACQGHTDFTLILQQSDATGRR